MKDSNRVYETTGINTAANLVALGFPVTVLRGKQCALFEFEDSEELRNAIIDYERGGFNKRLLNARSHLYHQASDIMKRGEVAR